MTANTLTSDFQPQGSLVAQQVKDLELSLQQLGSLLWHGFYPQPGELSQGPGKARKKTNKQN